MIEPLRMLKGRVAPPISAGLKIDWTNPDAWASSTPKHVFLGEAIQLIGQARFGDDWQLADSDPRTYDPLPAAMADATATQITRAARIVHVDVFGWLLSPDRNVTPPPITSEQWGAAFALDQKLADHAAKSMLRWRWVATYLEGRLRAGTLASFTRFRDGVDFYRGEQKLWFVDRPLERFKTCTMDPDRPADLVSGKKRWIFLDQEEIAGAVVAISADIAPATSLRRRAEFAAILLKEVQDNERNPYTRDYWQEQARQLGLPRDVFDEVWTEVMKQVPGTKWTAPGRPKRA